MTYTNPILPGFHPDPSICRTDDGFFLVTSSFEYFPGIPLFHSADLVHWEQIGHVLTRDTQVTLAHGAPNCLGIYAPTIRYHDGVFYCIVTNVGGDHNGNFFVWTDNPYGEWSDPVWLPFEGIDPSLLFDDDGKIYYSGTDKGIYIAEIRLDDRHRFTAAGEKHYVWNGSGGNNPEGPHLYKINGMYYLMIAEGGTEYCHMETIARSRDIYGPYEACPRNPILTNRSTELPIKAAGHADLVEDAAGSWWAVCLGIRPLGYPFRHNLGRETMLAPVVWRDGWPVIGENGHITQTVSTPLLPDRNPDFQSRFYIPGSSMTDLFDTAQIHLSWNTIYNPLQECFSFTPNGLMLHGNHCGISEDSPKALLCRRQEHFDFTAEVSFCMKGTAEGDEAGLSIYMNNRHHYEAALLIKDGRRQLVLRRQIGSLTAIEQAVDYESDSVTLRLCGSRETYAFSCLTPQGSPVPVGSGEAQYLTTEAGGCFTGNYVALYASCGEASRGNDVIFSRFSYLPLH